MRNTLKKACALLTILGIFVTTSGSLVYAEEGYEAVAKDTYYTFHSNTYEDTGKVTITANASNAQLGVTINDHFKSKNGYSYTENGTTFEPTMAGVNTNDVTFGVKAIDGLNFLYMDAPKNYTDAYGRLFSKALPAIPGINYITDAENATDTFTLDIDAATKDNVNGWGVKFMQHNDEKNYYMFVTSGSHTLSHGNKVLIWGLYKVKNGIATALKEVNTGDAGAPAYLGPYYNQRLVLTFDKGNMSVLMGYGTNNEYYSGTVVDSDPYTKADILTSVTADGKIEPVQLIALKGGSNTAASVNVAFKDILIYENVPYINSAEPSNVLYADVAKAAEAEVIDLGVEYAIRRLKYSGELTEGAVLVSNDGVTYKQLTDISSFTDGEWLNNITANKYRYVKSAAVDGLEILTDVDELTLPYNSEPFSVYAKANGESTTVVAADSKVAVVEGNTVSTVGVGQTTLSTENITATLKVTDGNSVYSSDFAGIADTENLVGSGINVATTAWRTKNADEGYMGQGNNAPVKLVSEKLRIYGSSNSAGYDYSLRYNQSSNNEYYPALVYENTGTGANQIIDMTFKKSDAYSYPAVKILAHNNGDGYILAFSGNNDGDKTWYLYKEVDGVVSLLANGERIADAPNGTFPLKNGEAKLRICYANGSIGFVLNYNNEYTIKGSCYDANPFNLNEISTDLWLMAGCKYGNITTDNLQRYVDFYDVTVNRYIENGFEFNRVLYENKADGKEINDGVIDLGTAGTVFYIKAAGVTDTVDVYASEDGNRYYYLASFAEDGYYQNRTMNDRFRFIKLDGSADDIKVFVKVNALAKVVEAEVSTADNTNLTIFGDNLAFTKGQTLLIAEYDENDLLTTVKTYKESVNFDTEGTATVTVDDFSSANKVKMFIWNSIGALSPVIEAVNLK